MSYVGSRIAGAATPAAKVAFEKVSDLHTRKLWHQLTEELKLLVTNPDVDDLLDLYEQFIKEFQAKLNPVSLVQILIGITRSAMSGRPADALAFLVPHLTPESDASKTVVTISAEAHVLLLSEVGRLRLRAADNAGCKEAIERSRELVDATFEMTPVVHSAFYQAAAEYHKVVGTPSEFFKNALQFLAYTTPESLTAAEQRQWAFDIGIAALVGQDIYNFGEVLSHAIVTSLRGGDHAWLHDLLVAFHKGSLADFDAVISRDAKKLVEQPALVASEEFLRQKVTLLALMELAFTRALDRNISFVDIATACRVAPAQVEYLLMRAMSLGLISGSIDNVDAIVCVTRVQPRVMAREPIGEMAERLRAWCGNVSKTLHTVKIDSKDACIT
jgi:26S proteasome regulatory subunit N9